jgi:hypothetical protein
MYVFSIDPGLVNIGVCFYDTTEQRIIFADKVQMVTRMKDLKTESEIIPRVYKLFFTGKMWEMIRTSSVVLIEQQMKKKFSLIQYVLGAICFEKEINYKFVSPRAVKTHFGSGKTARAGTRAAVRGNKNNYSANKKAAVALATTMFKPFMAKLSVTKRDDVADALLQAKYFADKENIYTERERKRVERNGADL